MRAHIQAAKAQMDKLNKDPDNTYYVRIWLRGGVRLSGDVRDLKGSVLVLSINDHIGVNGIEEPATGDLFVDCDDIVAIQVEQI